MSEVPGVAIYASKGGEVELSVALGKESVWLSQKQMANLFNKDIKTVNQHIRHIYEERELEKQSTISKSEIVQNEGGREVSTLSLRIIPSRMEISALVAYYSYVILICRK